LQTLAIDQVKPPLQRSGNTLLSAIGDAAIRFGTPDTDYGPASAATIFLTPCDCNGVAYSTASADDIEAQAGFDLTRLDDGVTAITGTALTIPTTTIIPYMQAADGKYYVIGEMRDAWGRVVYDLTSHKLQQEVRKTWGTFSSTLSDPQDIDTAVDCTTGA
jgi:hypothetical protein